MLALGTSNTHNRGSGHKYANLWNQHLYIQDVPGRKVNILGGHSIGHSKQNYIRTCVLFRTVH
jgi:hypothetical protein